MKRRNWLILLVMLTIVVSLGWNDRIANAVAIDDNGTQNETRITSGNKVIIVGDSRTKNMSNWVTQKVATAFVARSGQGYHWFVEDGIKEVNAIRKPGDIIIIWLGVNDYYSDLKSKHRYSLYAKKINELAKKEWADSKVYVAEVGYVDKDKMVAYFGVQTRSNVTRQKTGNHIAGIREFNAKLKASLNKEITWISTSKVIGIPANDKTSTPPSMWDTRKYGKKDGLHYGREKTQEIYDYFIGLVWK